jgi:hypothetical protein
VKRGDAEAPDFLDEVIAESEAASPGFGAEVDAAYERRVHERRRAPDDPLEWALALGATPEVAREVVEAWLGAKDPHPIARACALMREDALDDRLAPELRRWADMSSTVLLALLSVRP